MYVNAPSAIPGAKDSTFALDIKYDASVPMRIVADILDGAGTFYGGGLGAAQKVTQGKGTLKFPITVTTDIPTGTADVFIKIWNVRETEWSDQVADEPWQNEITRVDQPVTVGTALVACKPKPTECQGGANGGGNGNGGGNNSGGGGGGGGSNTGVVVGVVLSLLVVGALAVGGFIYYKKQQAGGGSSSYSSAADNGDYAPPASYYNMDDAVEIRPSQA